jgi:putative transposase
MTKRLTESQIVGILKEAEAGIPVPEVYRTYGVGQSTFYKWRSRYGSMEASDIRRIKEFEDGNRQLKQMYADLTLKSRMQEEIIKKLSGQQQNAGIGCNSFAPDSGRRPVGAVRRHV